MPGIKAHCRRSLVSVATSASGRRESLPLRLKWGRISAVLVAKFPICDVWALHKRAGRGLREGRLARSSPRDDDASLRVLPFQGGALRRAPRNRARVSAHTERSGLRLLAGRYAPRGRAARTAANAPRTPVSVRVSGAGTCTDFMNIIMFIMAADDRPAASRSFLLLPAPTPPMIIIPIIVIVGDRSSGRWRQAHALINRSAGLDL